MLTPHISNQEHESPLSVWTECYPPDFDHGGEPLLGADARLWEHLLSDVAFMGAECSRDGRVVVGVAGVKFGFVEVCGQYVSQGEPLAQPIADALKGAQFQVPVDRSASRLLGLDVELEEADPMLDWESAAQRIELDILSTVSKLAKAG